MPPSHKAVPALVKAWRTDWPKRVLISSEFTTRISHNQGKIEALGRRFMGIQADLSSVAPVPDIINKTAETFGRLEILVNNAGIIHRNKSIDFTEKDWDDVLNVNLKILFFLSQAGNREKDHKHRIDAVFPGRHSGAILYCQQKWGHGPYPAAGMRMGPPTT